MTAPLLTVSLASKKHCHHLRRSLAYGVSDVVRELLPTRASTLRRGEFWALEDVSFELGAGEALAVVGANGAGKSTLLRLLAGLMKPDRGEIRIRGSSEAILALGGALQPSLSGRENIELGAAMHGLDARARRRLVDEAIAFAELDEFIEDPVQSYSAGMKARLAYAISANLRSDLLLVDEALAVGDVSFQRKCISHMQRFVAEGGSLILVSHSAYHIQPVCTRGLLLDRGRAVFAGSAVEALAAMNARSSDAQGASPSEAVSTGIVDLRAEFGSGSCRDIQTGDPVRFTIRYRLQEPLDARWSISIWTDDQLVCVTAEMSEQPRRLEPGEGELSCVMARLPLVAGNYTVRASILDPAGMEVASFGTDGSMFILNVHGDGDSLTNLRRQMGQLVECDVEWE